MTLMNDGFLGIGSSKVDIAYPFTGAVQFYEDFRGVNTTWFSTTADAAKYRLGGTGTNVITAAEDIDGGGGKFQTGATDDNEFGAQLNGSGFFARSVTQGSTARQLRFAIRASISSITAVSAFFGMWEKEAVTSAILTPLTGTQPVGAGFVIVNGAVQYITKASGATTATAVGAAPALVLGVMNNFEIQMDGQNAFSFWVNGTKYLTTSTNTPLSATVGLSPAWGIKTTGGSAAKSLTVQRLYAGVEAPTGGW